MRWSSSVTIREACAQHIFWVNKQTSTTVSFEQETETTIQEGSAYVAIGPAAVATPLFSQRLQKKQDVRARLPAPNQRTWSLETQRSELDLSVTHQVLKLCRQAAIVGLLHVHDFRVGAKDVKLSRPVERASVGKRWRWDTLANKWIPRKGRRLNVVRKFSPSNGCNISRLPERLKVKMSR